MIGFRRIVLLGFAFLINTGDLVLAQHPTASSIAVGSQYDTTHVYVAPNDLDAFVRSFLGTFGGKSTPQVIATVTPTPSQTSSQLLQTPVGTVSLFGFRTPVPVPFGTERNGYLITNMTEAIAKARESGADVLVSPFPDPIGIDAVVQWPGGVNLQLYWHTKPPSYMPFVHVPENRVYVSADRVQQFENAFLKFSGGKVTSDEESWPADEIGKPGERVHRIRIESTFGRMLIFATDGHLLYPFGEENTGYEVDDLEATLAKAKTLGVEVIAGPGSYRDRKAAIVRFPGGYVAEIHKSVTMN